MLVWIKGAGDIASGVAHRLVRSGFQVIMSEIQQPTTVRCTVAFSRAVYESVAVVEGVTARLAQNTEQVAPILKAGEIALVVDPHTHLLTALQPAALVDAILAKRNLNTRISDAPVVVALGPGFTAGIDCHAVIETQRGHHLGRVLWEGQAAPNTGTPGEIGGYTSERLLRAGASGVFEPLTTIGQTVRAGEKVAVVAGVPIVAQIDGMVRGLLPAGTLALAGMKAGDIDPRGKRSYCDTISDKARAIAGGVLEALLHLMGGVQ